MKTIFLLSGLVLLAGCATPKTWHKDKVSTYNANNALAKCRYDVGMAKIHRNEREGMIWDCMMAKGYRYY